MRKILTTAISVAVLLAAGTAWGEAPKPDYGRSGWFVGVGGGAGWNFLSDAVENETGGIIGIDTAGSVNVRGGYRFWSWLALEGMYEGVFGLDVTQNLPPPSSKLADFDTHSLLVNLKFIAPIWRVHPYFALGVGAQYGDFDAIVGTPLDDDRWDPVLRFGLGVDGYITEHWVVNLELAPGIRFKDWGNIPSASTDNVTLTFSGGVQYRF
jgi:opacity protein-like surface antigen